MKIITALLCLVLADNSINAQFNLPAFNRERNSINKTGFIVLTAWSAANIVAGVAGQAASSGQAKYFHQMNLIWGGVNLLVALPSYLSVRRSKPDITMAASLKGQAAAEKTFIFNAGLDIGYVVAGGWLLQKGNTASNRDRYKGYGKSVVMQGAFLFLFDAVMFTTHNRHGKKLYKALESLQLAPNSLGLRIGF